MTTEFTPSELAETNEKCGRILEMINSIPKDDETHETLDQAFRSVWDAKQNVERRLLLEKARHSPPTPPAPPWEKVVLGGAKK